MKRPLGIAASLALLSLSCSDGGYEVVVELAPPSLASAAVVIDLAVVERCADQDDRGGAPRGPVLRSVVVRRGETPLPLGAIAPGSYGLYGRARAVDCGVIASGCVDVMLAARGSGTLTVTLSAVDGAGCPPGASCATGQCVDGDGGALPDASSDAGPPVSCATEGAACTAAGGAGGICFGGECCSGCWDGTACQPGIDGAACGTGGADCITCECPENGCSAGACVVPVPVAQIAGGNDYNCAVARDGSLWCWGSNSFGQLGQGDAGDGTERDRPVRVGMLNEWMEVMLGDDTACAWHDDRTAWCWGDNTDGQHGLGDLVTRAVPQRLPDIAWLVYAYGENDHACGLKDDSTLWCWGENQFGQLGLGDATRRTSPVQIGTDTWSIATPGGDHTCGIKSDGTLWCTGQNADGELGLGDIMPRSVLTQVGTATWDRLWAGLHYHCGRQTGGDVLCWGANGNAQLGVGDQTDKTAPVPMDPPTGWEIVGGGELHNCGIRDDGSLWCWGRDDLGQLGGGAVGTHVTSPRRIGTRTDWVDTAIGQNHSCALRADGTVWCTGHNDVGQLGTGDRTNRAELTAVCF